ncbi:MAG TPA: hypothetical protein ENH02_00735, partial [Bacteroidetes bacterium]|nr:hypothetical protein [Bacteroidota bacterium]
MNNFWTDIDKNIRSHSLQLTDWKKLFSSNLSSIYTTTSYNINLQYLYRARLNFNGDKPIDFFNHVNELWAPPGKKVNRDGRCNVKGQSTLYCATSPTTTLFEVRPNVGDEITFMDYDMNEKIENIGIVGCKEIVRLGNDYRSIFGQHFIESSKYSEDIDNILSAIFKSEHSEKYPIYNLTNAIYQIFTDEQKHHLVPKTMRIPKFNGLIYPSIVTNKLLGVNIAMDPNAAQKILNPFRAYKYKVLQKHGEHRYETIK